MCVCARTHVCVGEGRGTRRMWYGRKPHAGLALCTGQPSLGSELALCPGRNPWAMCSSGWAAVRDASAAPTGVMGTGMGGGSGGCEGWGSAAGRADRCPEGWEWACTGELPSAEQGLGEGLLGRSCWAQCPSERRVLRALAADGPLHGLRRGPEESTLNSACYSYIPQGATLKITSSGVPTKLGLGLGQGRWQGGMWVPCRPRTV